MSRVGVESSSRSTTSAEPVFDGGTSLGPDGKLRVAVARRAETEGKCWLTVEGAGELTLPPRPNNA